jgi:hypothetical protein
MSGAVLTGFLRGDFGPRLGSVGNFYLAALDTISKSSGKAHGRCFVGLFKCQGVGLADRCKLLDRAQYLDTGAFIT